MKGSWLGTVALVLSLGSQLARAETLAERLGYSRNDKLLLLQVDDLGVSRSINRASRDVLDAGLARSATLMVTAPRVEEAVALQKPHESFGVHVTLSCEWPDYPCHPAAGSSVPSLLDRNGTFRSSPFALLAFARTRDVVREMEAQIQKAFRLGMQPTHLDSHIGVAFFNPHWFFAYLNLARKYRIAPMIPRWSEEFRRQAGAAGWAAERFVSRLFQGPERAGFLFIDHLVIFGQPQKDAGYADRRDRYIHEIKALKPGVTHMIVHAAYADEEYRRRVLSHAPGQIVRDHEAKIFQDPAMRVLIEAEGVRLIDWREIQRAYDWNRLGEAGW